MKSEEQKLKLRSKYDNLISICILKGRTTTEDQFNRFLDSLINSISYDCQNSSGLDTLIELYMMTDTEESKSAVEGFSEECPEGYTIFNLHRDSDAGDLRNEFMATLMQIKESNFGESDNSFFGFMDGDDQVAPTYFYNLKLNIKFENNKSLIVINPASVYSDNGMTDTYPLKWTFNAHNAVTTGLSLMDLALEDVIGGQAWGKFYSTHLLASGAKFGKGLYEDVPFWYQICSVVKDWNNVCIADDVIYLWRRDNMSSLTRITPDWGAFCNAFDNLEAACEIAINKFKLKASDKKVWKRYTVGVLNLYRNALKCDEPQKYIDQLLNRVNWDYYKEEWLEIEEPNYIKRVEESDPNFRNVVKPKV